MKKKSTLIFIILILLLAAYLRLYRIGDYMTFLGDEGRDVLVAKEILGGNLTLLGPRSSAGDFFMGPIYYYMIAPFLLIFHYDPIGPAIMVALLGVATVVLVYKLGNEFFGKRSGIIAALFYAFSPLVIAYSRSSWQTNLMPFFSILTLYSLYLAVWKKDKRLFLLSGIFLGIAMQLHYLTTFLAFIVGVYLVITQFIQSEKINLTIKHIVSKGIFLFLGFLIG